MSPPRQRRRRDVTPRPCPLCGPSDVDPPTGCHLCGGFKIVDPTTWKRWSERPPAHKTSTTLNLERIAEARIGELRDRLGDRARGAIQRGEGLLAIGATWEEVRAPGQERSEHYQQIISWLEETSAMLLGPR